MNIKLYQIDAFTNKIFGGNPAAICILETWIDDDLMQSIAFENNLSETAFAVKNKDRYDIRWFTPTVEIDLCGHATLAAAFVLFNFFKPNTNTLNFYSHRSGALTVELKENQELELDFPVSTLKFSKPNESLNKALGATPLQTYTTEFDHLLRFESQKEIEDLKPDLTALSKINTRGIIVTAPGNSLDFVSRFFAPAAGIDEDPVTGSAHCALTPYWTKELNKVKLSAIQVSKRMGHLNCYLIGERVKIAGQCKLYMIGEIQI